MNGFLASAMSNRLPRGVYVWNEVAYNRRFVKNSALPVLCLPANGAEVEVEFTVSWGATPDAADEYCIAYDVPVARC